MNFETVTLVELAERVKEAETKMQKTYRRAIFKHLKQGMERGVFGERNHLEHTISMLAISTAYVELEFYQRSDEEYMEHIDDVIAKANEIFEQEVHLLHCDGCLRKARDE